MRGEGVHGQRAFAPVGKFVVVPTTKVVTFVKRLKDPKLFGEILDKDAVEGRVLPIYTHIYINL